MKTMAPEAETKHWAVSIAGITSWVVSVAATAYLEEYRRRETEIRDELPQLNDRLITEIEERERAEALFSEPSIGCSRPFGSRVGP